MYLRLYYIVIVISRLHISYGLRLYHRQIYTRCCGLSLIYTVLYTDMLLLHSIRYTYTIQYNTIFACIVIICIVAFIGSVGDILVLMELFLIFWIAYSTWGFMFAIKIVTVAQGEKVCTNVIFYSSQVSTLVSLF